MKEAEDHDKASKREAKGILEGEVTTEVAREDEFNKLSDEIFQEEYNKLSKELDCDIKKVHFRGLTIYSVYGSK